jgi:hypothetical protein
MGILFEAGGAQDLKIPAPGLIKGVEDLLDRRI